MTGKQWMTATFAAMTIAIGPSRAVAQAPPNQTQPAATTQPDVDGYFESLAKTVSEGTNQQRLDAAERLAEAEQFHARELIKLLLSGKDDRAQYACARAIADGRMPDPQWITALLPLLSHDRTTSEVAARALSRYEISPNAYGELIDVAKLGPAPNRPGAIAALGHVVQKDVAEALVSIVADTTQPSEIRSAAGDALTQLSGQAPTGDPTVFWNAWLAKRPENGIDWRKRVTEEQHVILQGSESLLRERLSQFRDRVNHRELQHYTDERQPDRKSAMLLELLKDPDPDLRAAGAFVAQDAINGVQPLSQEVRARLLNLIGDPSPEVRRGVAAVFFGLPDPNAFNAILLQLKVEPNEQIKFALIKAFARTDEKTVLVLREMVQQSPPAIAAAAADALRTSPFLQNQAQLRSAIDFLNKVLVDRTGQIGQPNNDPDLINLRANLVKAIAGLASHPPRQETIDQLEMLARAQSEPVPVRREALLGIGNMGAAARDFGTILQQELNSDDDPTMRNAAATALGNMGLFDFYDDVDAHTQPTSETNVDVRAAAREACSRLLSAGTPTQLQVVASHLERRQEYDRAIEAYKKTVEKLRQLNSDNRTLELDRTIALNQLEIGELYFQKQGNPQSAIPYYRDALTYFQTKEPSANMNITEPIISAMLKAYLTLEQYDEALKFGGQQIRRDRRTQSTVGADVANWAARLSQAPASADDIARGRRLAGMALDKNKSGDFDIDGDQVNRLQFLLPPEPTTNPAR